MHNQSSLRKALSDASNSGLLSSLTAPIFIPAGENIHFPSFLCLWNNRSIICKKGLPKGSRDGKFDFVCAQWSPSCADTSRESPGRAPSIVLVCLQLRGPEGHSIQVKSIALSFSCSRLLTQDHLHGQHPKQHQRQFSVERFLEYWNRSLITEGVVWNVFSQSKLIRFGSNYWHVVDGNACLLYYLKPHREKKKKKKKKTELRYNIAVRWKYYRKHQNSWKRSFWQQFFWGSNLRVLINWSSHDVKTTRGLRQSTPRALP